MPLHMYIYFTSLRFLLIRVQIRHKNTKNSWITNQILFFSVCLSEKNTQMFSKSALDASSKWQICTWFGCFCTLIRRKRKICQTFYPIISGWCFYKSFKIFFIILSLASLMVAMSIDSR